jgi:hypothetical protein
LNLLAEKFISNGFSYPQLKEKITTLFFKKKTEKKKATASRKDLKGCQGFGQKYYPSVRGWRFLPKPPEAKSG